MFNFLTSVKSLFGTSPVSLPKETNNAKESDNESDSVKNRAVFVSTKTKPTAKSKPAAPAIKAPVVDQAVVDRVLENAKRIESEAKIKEKEIFQRLSSLDEKERYLIQKEKTVDQITTDLKSKQESIEELYRKQLEKLEQISGLDVEKAKQLILSSTEKKMASWIAKKVAEAKDSIKQQEDEISKEVLVDAIRHAVTDYVAEYTVSTISLADEKVKGKIIGKEGRNIRAFEKATGVELELDESNDIRISSFDSVRREVARIALEKLIKDGRIQPMRIEQLVAQTKNEMDKILLTEGKRICQEVGVFNLPIDLIKFIGKYKYRFSYGQNLALHTIEATKIATNIAYELRADVNTVKLGALLHDIGKVITDQEGTHIDLGVDLLRQYKISEKVIACVAEHHEGQEFSSPESVIVYIGDAASGARPGARYEVHEEYLKRMKNIEEIAKSFPGVISVAAYQAGREVMVIVEPSIVNDNELTVLSQNIAEKLDEEAKWAGQIRVTCVRESRSSSIILGSKISKNAVKGTA
ncbi:Rnase Y domain-containing protein [Patescibacteria group bacterium]|nr:Rnase Y domain-containing protein [Patescibacteria group bacterium]